MERLLRQLLGAALVALAATGIGLAWQHRPDGDPHAAVAQALEAPSLPSAPPARAVALAMVPQPDFAGFDASASAHRVAEWVLATANNAGSPFLMLDKVGARLYVFDAGGRVRATSPALLGVARGDDSVPGIGQRAIPDIRPFERATPAGRFVAEAGRNAQGEDIVWVDHDAAISMHRVRANDPSEQRLQRLASPTPADNRISCGCINLPAAFFDGYVAPLARAGRFPVYILPEVRSEAQVFGWTAQGREPAQATSARRPAHDPTV
jgi:hypothetical protein